MTDRRPRLLQRSAWASHPTLWKGHVEGLTLGTNETVLFYSTEEVGRGPSWHVHPYDENFIIREGRALFTVGEIRIEAEAGQVVFGLRTSRTSSTTSVPGGWIPPTFT